MKNKIAENIDFLGNYFTTTEFDFINSINSGDINYDNAINMQFKYRDIVVTLINAINDNIFNITNEADTFVPVLTRAQDMFDLINLNIKDLQELKSNLSAISDEIVKLLVDIESNHNNIEYTSQIQLIKDSLFDFSSRENEVNKNLAQCTVDVTSFFNDEKAKIYFERFNINTKIQSSESQVKPSNNVVENHHYDSSTVSKNFTINSSNDTLLVSEKENKVFLPYKESEINLYLEQYPHDYKSFEDVVKKEYILPLDFYLKHPVLARFRETYSLIKDREGKSVVDSFKYAISIMLRYELSPVIIAACKTQAQLEDYLECLSKNKLDQFTDFKIKFEINPLKQLKPNKTGYF